ncbi:hypothetical protein [Chryseobacterium sp. JUb7]|uniref:hypothetical protein n=1 Tax=Chryseobacterium sp. JUb7 TaxID=2940599 RepID=UPI002169B788|nr:hypothetical protein [Chryseobacterium sp. JUb7]MCS3531308.1 lipase chaperone LimK [Chryseobacterium sp. JUb7]
MNKFFILTVLCLGLSAHVSAQKTQEQINKEYAVQYRKINENPKLSGPEKARLKKQLALKQDQDNKVFDAAYKKKYGTSKEGRKKLVEDKMGQLEKKYDREKDLIDDHKTLTKAQKKARKEALKKKYESQKEVLKREKDKI